MANKPNIANRIKELGKKAYDNVTEGVKRVKDVSDKSKAYYETLEPDLKSFIDEYEQMTGKKLIITSGRRNAKEGVGKYSNTSLHNTGNAFDIKSFHHDDFYYLMNTKDGLNLMNKYSLGIIDETDPRMMAKTGATGAHFHIGKDKKYSEIVRQRLESLNRGERLEEWESYQGWIEKGGKPEEFKSHYVGDGHDHSQEEVNKLNEKVDSELPYEWNIKDVNLWDSREAEKEIVKELKTEKDKDRQELVRAQKEVDEKMQQAQSFLQAYTNTMLTQDIDPLKAIEAQNQQQEFVQGYNYQVPLQDYNPNRFTYTKN